MNAFVYRPVLKSGKLGPGYLSRENAEAMISRGFSWEYTGGVIRDQIAVPEYLAWQGDLVSVERRVGDRFVDDAFHVGGRWEPQVGYIAVALVQWSEAGELNADGILRELGTDAFLNNINLRIGQSDGFPVRNLRVLRRQEGV